jgi:hypothetical protein
MSINQIAQKSFDLTVGTVEHSTEMQHIFPAPSPSLRQSSEFLKHASGTLAAISGAFQISRHPCDDLDDWC